MISEYLVAVWSYSHRYGHSSVKYYECDTEDEARTFAKREGEYLDTIGREYDIDIYINTDTVEVLERIEVRNKCKAYKMYEAGEDYIYPICKAQTGWPRAHCDGNKSKCPYIHKGGNNGT